MDFGIPDDFKKTTKIPAKYKDGKLLFYHNDKIEVLSLIKDDTMVELTVSSYSLINQEYLKSFDKEKKVLLLEKGKILKISLIINDIKKIESNEQNYIERVTNMVRQNTAPFYNHNSYFFDVQLLEDLYILYRGTKTPQLVECKCFIPILEIQANSLNHSYTLLSQKYQIQRNFHSGNVFKKAFYFDKSKNIFLELDFLRDKLTSREDNENFKF